MLSKKRNGNRNPKNAITMQSTVNKNFFGGVDCIHFAKNPNCGYAYKRYTQKIRTTIEFTRRSKIVGLNADEANAAESNEGSKIQAVGNEVPIIITRNRTRSPTSDQSE
jgi:hypothetical protein